MDGIEAYDRIMENLRYPDRTELVMQKYGFDGRVLKAGNGRGEGMLRQTTNILRANVSAGKSSSHLFRVLVDQIGPCIGERLNGWEEVLDSAAQDLVGKD